MDRLTVVVMNYNEAATLEPVVREILATGPDEVLIIDDGSIDDSSAVADRLASEDQRVRVVRHALNEGLGAVYRTGFREASGELLTFFPADGQFPASIVDQFRPHMASSDLVLGYLDREVTGFPRVERWLYRVVFGPTPPFQGIFMVRVARLRGLHLRSTGRGWTIVTEMLIRATRSGWRVESHLTPFRPRTAGRSKVRNIRTLVSQLWQTARLWQVLRN
jgi:dolichol-phosphate mannosyltransferase